MALCRDLPRDGGAGRLGSGGGGQTRGLRGLAQWQGEVPVSALGEGESCPPCSHLHPLSCWLRSLAAAALAERLPSGDFLPAQRDRRRLWLLCYLAGTHLHLLLSSQSKENTYFNNKCREGIHPGRSYRQEQGWEAKAGEEVLVEWEILSQPQEG